MPSSPRSFRARFPYRASACAAVAALSLTACAGGGDNGEEERIFVQSVADMPNLNPQFQVSPAVRAAGGSMMEPLVKITDDYELVPWLARDWEISEDGLEITLHLEEGVEWHDGEPFTSEDVAFNFEEVIELQYVGGQVAESIASVETPDEHTVVVHMDQPYGPFMEALPLQYMLPKHIYEGTEMLENPANREPVGTGPFVFDSFEEGDSAEVVRNENYWKGEVDIDRVIFAVFTDPNAQDLALLSGELDRGSIDSSRLEEVEQNPDLEVTEYGTMPWQAFFHFNSQTEELADPEVRQLVYAAIDKEQVHEVAVPQSSSPAESIYPESLEWAHSPNVNYLEDFAYDVDAINEGLDEAGWPVQDDGYRFTIDVVYMNHLADAQAIAEVMQSSLDEVGIRVELRGVVNHVYHEQVFDERNFDTTIQIGTTETDPNLGITIFQECNDEGVRGRNPSGVCDELLDEYAEGALRSVGEEDRGEYLQQLEERAAELMISAPIVNLRGLTAYNATDWEGAGYDDRAIPAGWDEVRAVE